MNYKKKYKRQRERNKSLMDRIDDLTLEISEINNTKSESTGIPYLNPNLNTVTDNSLSGSSLEP